MYKIILTIAGITKQEIEEKKKELRDLGVDAVIFDKPIEVTILE